MLDLLIDKLHDVRLLTMIFAAVAAAATVITLAMPLLAPDTLNRRMKAVALEREKIRQRERERMKVQSEKVALRKSPKQYMKTAVERFNLNKWVGQEEAREKLVQAGYRGQAPYVTYLFFRMVMPVAMLLFSLFYVFVVLQARTADDGQGRDLPGGRLSRHAYSLSVPQEPHSEPAALDQAGVSGRARSAPHLRGVRHVDRELVPPGERGDRHASRWPLAEEFKLTTAELSYLPERRQAYENLGRRTDLDGVKSVCVALAQAERYGTPLGQTLRVMAQENRDMRMSEAEKKAAALPPKLTVPMILFFLPSLFIVILGPAAIRVMALQ